MSTLLYRGGGGEMVIMLVFYSDDPSSNPAESYNFYSVSGLIRKGKGLGMGHLKK